MNPSPLAEGNLALRNKQFEKALHHYRKAEQAQPELAHLIQANIKLATRRLDEERAQQPGEHAIGIDIVVPVFNALEDVKVCLASLQSHTDGFQVRVIVVNDGSDEATTQWLREFCEGKQIFSLIEHPTNSGYTRAVNSGLKASTAPYVITQNSDTIVSDGWLTGLIRCMRSATNIGIVGPLSNAASWQNVPALRDTTGSFAVNDLPAGLDVDAMARTVAQASVRAYPRLPFVNGFCFMISRAVIEAVGYMDELNFPVGYGEENDFCIRAQDAGFELAIADDVFVFHAKSKSFGHERRKTLSEQGTRSLKNKHTVEKYQARVETVKKTDALDAVRARIQSALEQGRSHEGVDLMNMRILFLLPVKGGGGGAHSVVQEVTEMRRMGIDARVAVKNEQVEGFLKSYADIAGAKDTFVGFDDYSLIDLAEDCDVVVGTIFTSMKLVKRIVEVIPHILPAYYVQDYEPMFFDEGTAKWQEARESYTLVPNAFLFAKTQWIIDEVKRHHGVAVHKVQPSIDHDVYKPAKRQDDGKLHVTAMIRPQTPYRGAERTMRLLARLHLEQGERISLHIFGCESTNAAFEALQHDFPFVNHGPLLRPQVSKLLAQSDLFIDLSDYQAFGRTSLEAMACGCTAVVPCAGGGNEYAVHNVNALVVNTLDERECFDAVSLLIANAKRLRPLQRAALSTASNYSVHAAAVSECVPIEERLRVWRNLYPRRRKPSLVLLPSLRADGLPTGSGYVRVVLPYLADNILSEWRVRQSRTLPEPGTAEVALIQREAIGHTLSELEDWLTKWKAKGGRLVFEIDDDLFDADGLRARHHKGDVKSTVDKVRFLARSADLVHVSTEPLAKKIRLLNNQVEIIPNAIDQDLWLLNHDRKHDEGTFGRYPNTPIRIGYIGTPTHDADLAIISEAMKAIEKKFQSKIEIEVIGGFQNQAPTFGKRIALPKSNDYPNFVRWLQQRVHWDIGVIPLAENAFNTSKSDLKVLEYSSLHMAVVASDHAVYRNDKNFSKHILFADTVAEWIDALTNLIDDADRRKNLADGLRNYTTEFRSMTSVTTKIKANLQKMVGRTMP